MIIEFPKKYSVQHQLLNRWAVSVPAEAEGETKAAIEAQPWATILYNIGEFFVVSVNAGAYEITQEQAQAALERICEHVMTPTPEVDEDVWGEALEDGE